MVSYGCAIAIFLQSCILNGIFTQYFLVFCKLSCFCYVHTACRGMVRVAVMQWVLKLGGGLAALLSLQQLLWAGLAVVLWVLIQREGAALPCAPKPWERGGCVQGPPTFHQKIFSFIES